MSEFYTKLQNEMADLLAVQQMGTPSSDSVCIDLHCHDCNSDVPDELWGRILRVPETYLSTGQLFSRLQSARMDGMTVTNHNNARSCWALLEKGHDILVGAEFTCFVPDIEVQIHVLTYGFTPAQEASLVQLRRDLYRFLDFTAAHDLPTVLAHPLYFYSGKKALPGEEYLARMALLFERFEVFNGQRDIWQNCLTARWLGALTEEKLCGYAKQYGIDPLRYNRQVLPKRFTGGSDDHMGLFVGKTGTLCKIDQSKRAKEPLSALILEALRSSALAPYGATENQPRMQIALLDYLCQLGLNMKDPGLIRMALHQGELKDKVICMMISNAIQEMKRHKYTSGFLRIFHEALAGHRPSLVRRLAFAKDYRPIATKLATVAARKGGKAAELPQQMDEFLPFAFDHLMKLLVERITAKVGPMLVGTGFAGLSINELIKKLEVPSHIRYLFSATENPVEKDDTISKIDLLSVFDQISFPALFSGVIMAANLISTRVMFHNRKFLDGLAASIGGEKHPQRVLWLTDTLYEKNGVSHALRSLLAEVKARELPVDFLVCGSAQAPEEHLITVPSLGKFHLGEFEQQPFNVPNLLEIFNIFRRGGYDRIVCSTEFMMGLVALYLQKAFHVPCHFYMHTDWMEFFAANTDLDESNMDRVRRALRTFYQQFDGIFVLNHDHEEWLASSGMGIERAKIHKTAHWASDHFVPHPEVYRKWLPGSREGDLVVLYAGRLGREKGVMELPAIWKQLKAKVPQVKMVIAGSGPQEDELRRLMPEAIFLGWVKSDRLPTIYASADLLVLPSRFDTFGLVVLEALSCGLPVAAYDVKGPRDLIQNGYNGITAADQKSLIEAMALYLQNPKMMASCKSHAVAFAKKFDKASIMDRLLSDLGLDHCSMESADDLPANVRRIGGR